jgi:hypothetical protein
VTLGLGDRWMAVFMAVASCSPVPSALLSTDGYSRGTSWSEDLARWW